MGEGTGNCRGGGREGPGGLVGGGNEEGATEAGEGGVAGRAASEAQTWPSARTLLPETQRRSDFSFTRSSTQ